jgi:hypothetical protein
LITNTSRFSNREAAEEELAVETSGRWWRYRIERHFSVIAELDFGGATMNAT